MKNILHSGNWKAQEFALDRSFAFSHCYKYLRAIDDEQFPELKKYSEALFKIKQTRNLDLSEFQDHFSVQLKVQFALVRNAANKADEGEITIDSVNDIGIALLLSHPLYLQNIEKISLHGEEVTYEGKSIIAAFLENNKSIKSFELNGELIGSKASEESKTVTNDSCGIYTLFSGESYPLGSHIIQEYQKETEKPYTKPVAQSEVNEKKPIRAPRPLEPKRRGDVIAAGRSMSAPVTTTPYNPFVGGGNVKASWVYRTVSNSVGVGNGKC